MSETRVEESRNPGIDEIIRKAVVATRLSCARDKKSAFKSTEKMLYAYPVMQAKKKYDEANAGRNHAPWGKWAWTGHYQNC